MTAETGGDTVRSRVVYSGRVQGVFFRATARDLARGRAVVGYVRNQPDGTVELEAEGVRDEVEAFLAAVESHFAGYVTDAARTTLPARGGESRFEIRY
ncbi:MAG: acylphosphatase [Phycisphaerae bacterium]|nr:acylphosphatase [Phycisphaerae bacterium]